jgi:hypothetical protein
VEKRGPDQAIGRSRGELSTKLHAVVDQDGLPVKLLLSPGQASDILQIGQHDTAIVMHNDGVVQGLFEVPFTQDVRRWGVPTIGTGLGNAHFTNRNH